MTKQTTNRKSGDSGYHRLNFTFGMCITCIYAIANNNNNENGSNQFRIRIRYTIHTNGGNIKSNVILFIGTHMLKCEKKTFIQKIKYSVLDNNINIVFV